MEMATWQLVHVLCSDRVTEGMGEEMVTELLGQDGASDKDMVDEYFTRDSNTRQAQARRVFLPLRKSLHLFPPPPPPPPLSLSLSAGCRLAGTVC